MRYQVKVAGKIFEGNDPRTLLKRAVEAKRATVKARIHSFEEERIRRDFPVDVTALQA